MVQSVHPGDWGLKTRTLDESRLSLPQKRALRLWLAARRRRGAANADETEARLHELCASEGWDPEGSDGEEEDDEEEEMDNSEPLDDSDVVLSDSGRGQHSPLVQSGREREHLFHVSCLTFSGL